MISSGKRLDFHDFYLLRIHLCRVREQRFASFVSEILLESINSGIWRRICHLTTEEPAAPLAEVFVYEPLETVDKVPADLLVI